MSFGNYNFNAPEAHVPLQTIIQSIDSELEPMLAQRISVNFDSLKSFCFEVLKDKNPNHYSLLYPYVLYKLLFSFENIIKSKIDVQGRPVNNLSNYSTSYNEIQQYFSNYLNNLNTGIIGKFNENLQDESNNDNFASFFADYLKNIVVLFDHISVKLNFNFKSFKLYLELLKKSEPLRVNFNPIIPIIAKNFNRLLINSKDLDKSIYLPFNQFLGQLDFADLNYSFYKSFVSATKINQASLYDDLIELFYYNSINNFYLLNFTQSNDSLFKLITILSINSKFNVNTKTDSSTPSKDFLSSSRRYDSSVSIRHNNVMNDDSFFGSSSGSNFVNRTNVLIKPVLPSVYFKSVNQNFEDDTNISSKTEKYTSKKTGKVAKDRFNNNLKSDWLVATLENNALGSFISRVTDHGNKFIFQEQLVCYYLLINYIITSNWDYLEENYYSSLYDTKSSKSLDLFAIYLTAFKNMQIPTNKETIGLYKIVNACLKRNVNEFSETLWEFTLINKPLFDVLASSLFINLLNQYITKKVFNYGKIKKLRIEQFLKVLSNSDLSIEDIITNKKISQNERSDVLWKLLSHITKNSNIDEVINEFANSHLQKTIYIKEKIVYYSYSNNQEEKLELDYLLQNQSKFMDYNEDLELVAAKLY